MARTMVQLAAAMTEVIDRESYALVLGAAALIIVDALEKSPAAQADPVYRKLTEDLRDLVRAVDDAIDWATVHDRLRAGP